MKTTAAPVQEGERIELLDMLRGLAIFGILVVNMHIFYQPMLVYIQGYTGSASTADLFAELGVKLFFEGKFYVLFSMLFGYGFYLYMQKQVPEGRTILPVFRRRLLFLLLFGIAHVVLLWPGDILIPYALMGFLLILFRKVSDRGLVKWAVWLAMSPVLLNLLLYLGMALLMRIPEFAAEMEKGLAESHAVINRMVEKTSAVYAGGSFGEIVTTRISEYFTLMMGMIFMYPLVLGMFLLGIWAARKQLIAKSGEHLPFFRRLRWWGLGLGLPLSAAYAWSHLHVNPQLPDALAVFYNFSHLASGLLLCLVYVSTIVLLVHQGRFRRMGKWLAPVGRMALTNYLLHSIICTTLFLSYGFGLYGRISTWQGVLIAVAIFLVQIPWSHWWLNHFRYGPLEWLWRSLTYLKWQKIR